MPPTDTRTASTELLREAQFHRGALLSGSATVPMATEVQKAREALMATVQRYAVADDLCTEKLGVLQARSSDLDERIRLTELRVQGAVGKDRRDPAYRAAFPKGLTALIVLRGEAQAREVKSLVMALQQRLPKIAAEHGQALLDLAGACVRADQERRDAEDVRDTAHATEVAARGELIRCLQRSEGALLQLFPGERRRVRQFFLRKRRAKKNDPRSDHEAASAEP